MPRDDRISGALEVRRNDIQRFEAMAGGVWDNTFLVDVSGIGDAIASVDFTVRFVELPIISTGWHMQKNQRLKVGEYPQIHVGVFDWNYGVHPGNGYPFYDGATLAISVINGPTGMLAQVHVGFRGRALRNPAGQ